MPYHHDLSSLTGQEWLVAARNEVQTLMLHLHRRWARLDRPFKGVDGKDVSHGRVGAAANAFLLQVIRTNAITFTDDMRFAPFTAGYYINNAVYRVSEMQGKPRSNLRSSVRTMRTAWNDAHEYLLRFAAGTIPGTSTTREGTSSADRHQ